MLSDTQRLAYHDPLTSLCNRVLFTELASHALAAARAPAFAILAIDLDRFKIVNDTYGHGTGDQILKIAAERMTGALRSSDVLSRFGGDEFVVLLDAGGQEAAEQVARNLNAALAAPTRRTRGPERIHRHRGLSGRRRHLNRLLRRGQGAVPGQGRRPQPLRDRHGTASGGGVGLRRYRRVTRRRRGWKSPASPMVAIGSGSVRLAWLVSRAQEARTGLSLAKGRQRAPAHQEGLGNGLPWFTLGLGKKGLSLIRAKSLISWSGRRDSNSRPSAPKSSRVAFLTGGHGLPSCTSADFSVTYAVLECVTVAYGLSKRLHASPLKVHYRDHLLNRQWPPTYYPTRCPVREAARCRIRNPRRWRAVSSRQRTAPRYGLSGTPGRTQRSRSASTWDRTRPEACRRT